MANYIIRRQGIMSEHKNLVPSIASVKAKEKKAIEILIAELRGKIKKENQSKYRLYPEVYDREYNRLYHKLINIRFDNDNLNQIVQGYIQYLNQNKDRFNYLELRKYRIGVLKTIIKCAKEYGLSDTEILYYINGCINERDEEENDLLIDEEETAFSFDGDEDDYADLPLTI